MKTIYILWLRQIKRHLRSKPRMIGSLGQPILFLLAFGYGFGSVFQQAGQGNYIQFLAPGIIGISILFTAMFSGIELIWDRQFGFLKETLVAPVSRFDIMMGRTLGGATVATMQGVIVLLICLLAGFHPYSWITIPATLGVMLLISFVFTGFGTVVASRLTDMQGFQLIMNFLIMPLFFLSGALFPLRGLPQTLDILAKIDPLSYGIDALRSLLINTQYFGLGLDLAVLLCCAALVLILGSYSFAKMEA